MLNRRSLVSLVLAVLFGLGAVLATRGYLARQHAAAAPDAPTVAVATAGHDLAVGTGLSGSDLAMADWPRPHLPEGAILDRAALQGRVLRRAVAKGEPILEPMLLPAGTEAGLPAVIEKNHRAVSVKVDAVIGVAGFVKPGARVDVAATLSRADVPSFSKVILQDVRVLAVDQTMEQVKDGDPKVVSVVTVEVDPDEAQRLVHAAHEGQLQLALRNPADQQIVPTRSVHANDLAGPARREPAVNRASVQVIKGASVTRATF